MNTIKLNQNVKKQNLTSFSISNVYKPKIEHKIDLTFKIPELKDVCDECKDYNVLEFNYKKFKWVCIKCNSSYAQNILI